MPTAQTVQTTTLLVSRPADFPVLDANFTLVRYVLPAALRSKNYDERNKSSRANIYAQLHNSLRSQLDYPYRTFMFDRIDGRPKWVVYMLVPHGEVPKALRLGFQPGPPLEPQPIPFSGIEFHVLLKLLQIAYFRGEQPGYFIGQDYCYVYAKRSKELECDICVEVQLQGDIRNRSLDPVQEFKVIGGAHPFRRLLDEPQRWSGTYFGRRFRNGKVYYIHLRVDRAQEYMRSGKAVYTISPLSRKRTTLPYHSLQRVEASRGKILYDFIQGFTHYLAGWGITSRVKERTFHPFAKVPTKRAGLPLHLLETVYVYDNRLQPAQHSAPPQHVPLQAYVDLITRLLTQLQPGLRFAPITDLAQAHGHPVLALQDHEEEDFKEQGILFGVLDPYEALYAAFPHLSKQSLGVNPRNADEKKGLAPHGYLSYGLPGSGDEEEDFCQKLQMALYQLYLKDVISNERSVQERLPFYPTPFLFIRKRRVGDRSHELLLHLENDTLRFIDLQSPDGKHTRDELLAQLGIDWAEMEERMLTKYHKLKENGTAEELPRYDIIVGPDTFIELEGLNERVLYDYDEVLKRRGELDKPIRIDDLKLTPYYDMVRPKSLPDATQLQEIKDRERYTRGALTEREREALKLFQQLEAYDALLDEIGLIQPAISYNDLTDGWMHRIAPIFDIQPNDEQRYRTGSLRRLYRQCEMFLSDKANELYLYEGIWYDDTDHSYLVGSTQGINQAQTRAHLIRHFDVYQGEKGFDMTPLLTSMSIRFIRLKQFTVYPYPFHLISLYAERALQARIESLTSDEDSDE
jgi:hypothetical protein